MIKIWSWYLHWLQNNKSLNLEWPFFSCFMKWNWRLLSLKFWHFEASEDIRMKFKSQALHVIRIKYYAHGCSPFILFMLAATLRFKQTWKRMIILYCAQHFIGWHNLAYWRCQNQNCLIRYRLSGFLISQGFHWDEHW